MSSRLLKQQRLGAEKYNNQGCLMRVVEYNGADNVIVEFQDEYHAQVRVLWHNFQRGTIKNPNYYFTLIKENTDGHLMKIIEYNDSDHIIVEFQDEYKYRKQTSLSNFRSGKVKNKYAPSLCGVGILGDKYPLCKNGKYTKIGQAWEGMIQRCYGRRLECNIKTMSAYDNAEVCSEWLLFDNFYEWVISQDNYQIWENMPKSAVDKDIIVKGNNIYSPNTCCLVPNYVNTLFLQATAKRGKLPVGVTYNKKNGLYYTQYTYTDRTGKVNHHSLGSKKTPEEAFQVYKQHKEACIKQVAQEEYNKGTISKKCYEAMMRWEIEIED